MSLDRDVEYLNRAQLKEVIRQLRTHIREHRDQKADDRCWMDDEVLYSATLPEPLVYDRRVGDPLKMVENCKRFVKTHCEGGHWTSYADLEAFIKGLRDQGCHRLRHAMISSGAERSCWERRAEALADPTSVTDDSLLRFKQGLTLCIACAAKLVLEEGIVVVDPS